MYATVKSLSSIPQINIILYINFNKKVKYTHFKKKMV